MEKVDFRKKGAAVTHDPYEEAQYEQARGQEDPEQRQEEAREEEMSDAGTEATLADTIIDDGTEKMNLEMCDIAEIYSPPRVTEIA